ncbi:MAG: gluconate 2-dehydrogenase subunit 3 family protein [Halobellus sp.]|uniref:gluconate 2-dehydrogenase subunit 3 family protein n=1 Tax=Halobellus sp. TaxID=1979212 RepID=UPI0035D4179F
MELTRRDALAALAATGSAIGGGVLAGRYGAPTADAATGSDQSRSSPSLSTPLLDLLDGVAEVLYPSDVEGRRAFVETYVLGRIDDQPSYRAGMREAAAQLDALARDWEGTAYATLDVETRDQLFRGIGVETADPEPAGTLTERVRFYLVNDLLFAFYSSPTGGRLVGIENPIGHPGGIKSYQRGSMSDAAATQGDRTDDG